jgi:hypothetical protein
LSSVPAPESRTGSAEATDRDAHAGSVIGGRYEIRRPLGQGSFGHTFLAHDRSGGRHVAIKVLHTRGAADWKAHELFEREAAVLRSLRHQGVPEVHDLIRDVWDGAPAAFLVMEYIEGTPLARIIDEQRQLDPGQVMHLVLELLGVLAYLHGRVPPILHRDIKPSNIIMRPDGLPALVDFGSVRRIFLDAAESGSTVAGTYGYMPYEQYMGQATPASDLYALAATVLHLITGRPPREFMSDEGRIQVPDTLPGDPRLRPVIERLLRPSPAERFASANDVRAALLSAIAVPPGTRSLVQGGVRGIARREVAPVSLGPTPRAIEGDARELYRALAPSALQLMDSAAKPGDEAGLADILAVVMFSVLTAGILPLVFFSLARARRRRLRRFLREGTPAVAQIFHIEFESIPFDEKLSRVSYEFEADGGLHRDSDQVMPMFANRWKTGDQIQILYIAGHAYDSVIISTS